ncbi:MAG: hypothetical protein HQL23_07545 [Candidatus Omnitrophica bacterium]|nr:hypothetical protein [Candidatus Omnitrophota bacterium]
MFKQRLKFKAAWALVLGLSLLCSSAYAQRNDRRDDRRNDRQENNQRDMQAHNQRNNQQYHRGERYHYRDGRWYKRGWFGWEFAASVVSIGALIESLPPNHSTIVVQDTPYYYDGQRYYQQLPDGIYVVVQPPG